LDGKVSKTGPRWRVHLVPVERERIEDVLRYAETLTGDNGAFRLRNLAPGKYWVLALPVKDDSPESTPPAALDPAARLRLRRAAEAANRVLELQPCQRLAKYEIQP
jgi:hypothetical protein